MHAIMVTFHSTMKPRDLEEAYRPFAEFLHSGAVPGFLAKTWLSNAPRMGGFYLFQDRETADRYLEETLRAALGGDPRVSDIQIARYDVNDELSSLTHGVPTMAVSGAA